MLDTNLAIINLETGEITPLDEWLHHHRRRQLQLILAQLGQGAGAQFQSQDAVEAAARQLFAPRSGAG